MSLPRALILASGGGSGAEVLIRGAQAGQIAGEFVAIGCNKAKGEAGVWERGERLGVPVIHHTDLTPGGYQALAERYEAEFVFLSGYLLKVPIRRFDYEYGLRPHRTVNIHPGPLPEFGGKGMHGHHVHEAVLASFHRGERTHSAVTMHYALSEYDDPDKTIFVYPVPILEGDTADALGARVNAMEHLWQPRVTDMVLRGEISWTGNPWEKVRFPDGWPFA